MAANRCILVVEDDQVIRESLQELFESEGYSVVLAENGRRALEILAEGEEVGLVLLDLSMPIMSGAEFLAEFYARFTSRRELPILIMTAAGRQEIPPHPTDRVLRKPLDVDLLIATVHRFLP